ncbi:MAG TPA: hypothetical protein VJB90_00380 [Candidatus Nanoarchaeia archaeon]|nr:hypothetical protein [Candidatus Nanoarchaeia archaeon]
MGNRNIELYSFEDRYQIDGNSHVVVWRSKGDVVVETPEMGLRGGIDGKAMKSFSLDEKTRELSLEFLQSDRPNQINIGVVSDYEEATRWVKSVNELYLR